MGWAAGAGEGIGGVAIVAIDVYGYGYGYGGGVGVWRMVGRGRKEKDLMVGQISFYVFCCCVVRMDGFVQNRINEFVQRHFCYCLISFNENCLKPPKIIMSCFNSFASPRNKKRSSFHLILII